MITSGISGGLRSSTTMRSLPLILPSASALQGMMLSRRGSIPSRVRFGASTSWRARPMWPQGYAPCRKACLSMGCGPLVEPIGCPGRVRSQRTRRWATRGQRNGSLPFSPTVLR